MTVEEMMVKISCLRQLASDVDKIASKNTGEILYADLQRLDDAVEAIQEYIYELGRKKIAN